MIRLGALLAGACLLAIAAASAGAARPVATVQPIGPALARTMTGVSWRPGCPVGLRDLRVVTARHWGFDGREHTGRIVVNRDVAADVASVLRRLHAASFPIRRMVPVDAYGASDFRSIEADNTSAFNCRYVEGTSRWSEHAYGRAIDFNPIETAFSKLKALLGKAAERTVDGLWATIGKLTELFTPLECANYFAAAGYDAV